MAGITLVLMIVLGLAQGQEFDEIFLAGIALAISATVQRKTMARLLFFSIFFIFSIFGSIIAESLGQAITERGHRRVEYAGDLPVATARLIEEVKDGDVVVISGHKNLRDGREVEVVQQVEVGEGWQQVEIEVAAPARLVAQAAQ